MARPSTEHKYAGVREALRHQIHLGVYPSGAKLPSETDLIEMHRASRNTVIRALHDLAQEGVIIRRMGSGSFVADPEHHPLLPERFVRLGILLPHSLTPDFQHCRYEHVMVLGALAKWNLDTVQPVFARVHDDEATRGEWMSEARGCCVEVLGEELSVVVGHPPLSAVRAARLDGILTININNQAWLDKLLDLNIPAVLVDFPNAELSSRADQVYFDPLPAYRATVHTMAARGLRRIHFTGCWTHKPPEVDDKGRRIGPKRDEFDMANARPDPDNFLRKAAWRQAMDEAGLSCPDEWGHMTWYRGKPVQELAEQLAALPPDKRPEAMVCHGIEQAEIFIEVFRARGLPLEAAGVTTGLHRHTAWSIFADQNRLGSLAAELLLRRIRVPTSDFLREGMAMVFPKYMQHTSLQMTEN